MKRGENRLNNSLQLKKLFEQLQVTTKTKISSQIEWRGGRCFHLTSFKLGLFQHRLNQRNSGIVRNSGKHSSYT